ncbi:unnamed protein product [Paramecium primaurelia]|uniref:Transmembrane protein n=1 Tax=Paramecium primaurelia TaxID=5886 RepID=A0A8S1QUU6_PARPR|nr:unnamed protein product [Paramecium primaurelia]
MLLKRRQGQMLKILIFNIIHLQNIQISKGRQQDVICLTKLPNFFEIILIPPYFQLQTNFSLHQSHLLTIIISNYRVICKYQYQIVYQNIIVLKLMIILVIIFQSAKNQFQKEINYCLFVEIQLDNIIQYFKLILLDMHLFIKQTYLHNSLKNQLRG